MDSKDCNRAETDAVNNRQDPSDNEQGIPRITVRTELRAGFGGVGGNGEVYPCADAPGGMRNVQGGLHEG
jgi:hypothetical protein